jgi:polyisoprenoid-binding protein YceI
MKQLLLRLAGVTLLIFLLSACSSPQTPPASPPAETESAAAIEELSAESVDTGGLQTFQIVPMETTARFELDEDLRSALTGWALGARITVVGETGEVSGEITADPGDLSGVEMGEIRIDAGSFYTTEYFRNKMIRVRILQSDTYGFIIFQPTAISGLPAQVEVGESITFTVNGELTIRDVTRQEAFAVTAVLTTPTELTGSAAARVSREAYGLTIPSVPNVTFVEDEVELYIDFVARSE